MTSPKSSEQPLLDGDLETQRAIHDGCKEKDDELELAQKIITQYASDNATPSRILRPGRTDELTLAEAVVRLSGQLEAMLTAEMNRLMLASEDEIRKEILADGRDPDEYLRAIDSATRWAAENAILKSDLAAQSATQAADAAKVTLRPEVAAFAEAMELQLRKNDWKGHWRYCTGTYLFNRLRGEVNELSRAPTEERLKEAADVANFAMMIADNAKSRVTVSSGAKRDGE